MTTYAVSRFSNNRDYMAAVASGTFNSHTIVSVIAQGNYILVTYS